MLFIKMLKDLQQNITQFLAIFVMAFISLFVVAGTGVSDYDAFNEYLQDVSYKDLNLSGIAFTMEDINSIDNLKEIKAIDGYYNTSGKVALATEEIKVLISYITDNNVSKLYIVEGEPFSSGEPGVWVDKKLADYQNIKVGDTIDINTEGFSFSEKVRGICYSPKYMYYVVDSTFVEPQYDKYGFLFMDITQYPGEEKYFDELLIDVNGAEGQLYPTEEDKRLINVAKRKIMDLIDDPALVINEKNDDYQFKTYAETIDTYKLLQIIFPVIFGAIALLGILTTMTRIISRQRITIGALKALGFSSKTITIHYMSYSIFIILAGCIAGAVVGYYVLGNIMYGTNVQTYLMPYERMEVSAGIFIFTAVLLGSAALVSYFSNAKVLNLSASQILQPEAPKASGKSFFENMSFWKKLRFATQWNIRDISNNLFRTIMSIFGVTVCSGLLFGSFAFRNCLKIQGSWLYRELIMANTKIEFSGEANYGTVYDYAKEYKGQMIQVSSIRVKKQDGEYNSSVFVVDKGNLYNFHDENTNYVKLPPKGAAMTRKYMELTQTRVGDRVSFIIEGKKDIYTTTVTSVIRVPVEQGIYITRENFEDIRGDFVPNILYTGLPVSKDLEDKPEIISVNTTEDLMEGMDSTNANLLFIVEIIVIMAIVIGSVILYNMGSMSYNEKIKDMATLKVLGFQSKDLKMILMQQNLFITGIGTVIGFSLGRAITDILCGILGSTVDCIIRLTPMPYIIDVCFVFVLSIVVNTIIVARLEDINMVEALKGV